VADFTAKNDDEQGTASAAVNFVRLAGGNSYFFNINPANSNGVSYLSRDLRVFSLFKRWNELPGNPSAPKSTPRPTWLVI
jgi:hypothetical protein